MESRSFEYVLRVKELDQCRIFYRDTLGLGEPEIDSSFAVRFRLGQNCTLSLIKSSADYFEHAAAPAAFALEIDDLDAFAAAMEKSGNPLDTEVIRIGVNNYRRGTDPEGNFFYAFARCDN